MTQILQNRPKPAYGASCNNCGYCCTAGPCELAEEFLNCKEGTCVALEWIGNTSRCGLVRNPLGYLYKATKPDSNLADLEPPSELGAPLSQQMAASLGIGKGCDAVDDEESLAWNNLGAPYAVKT